MRPLFPIDLYCRYTCRPTSRRHDARLCFVQPRYSLCLQRSAKDKGGLDITKCMVWKKNTFKQSHFMCSRSCIYTRPKFGHYSLQWCHDGRDGVSNHQPHDCLVTRLFMQRSKKASKLRDTGLCVGNSAVTGEFPTQRASNAEKVSIWWRHHVLRCIASNGARPSAIGVATIGARGPGPKHFFHFFSM